MYGVANILTRKLSENTLHLFGAETVNSPALRLASPVTHVTKTSVPILTLHGRNDETVDYAQAEELDRVAKERGAPHELILLDGVGHTFDLQTWKRKPLPRDLRPVVLEFLGKHMPQ